MRETCPAHLIVLRLKYDHYNDDDDNDDDNNNNSRDSSVVTALGYGLDR
jgi:hypothetical protein